MARNAAMIQPRMVRAATQRRVARRARARYVGLTRALGVLTLVLILLMSYVVLTASLTGLSYAVAHAKATREALQEETMRLDNRLAALRSDDRLSQLAIRLGMTEPQRFAIIRIEAPRIAKTRAAFPMLSSLAGFFIPAVPRQQ
jgi:hypothetical protein